MSSTVHMADSEFWDLANAFLVECASATSAAYRRDLTCFENWCLAHNILPATCRRVDVASYLQALRNSGYSESTVGRRLACLRSFFRYLVDEGIVNRSPAAAIRWRRADLTPQGALTAAELASLLKAADQYSPRVAATVWVLATTGARVSEVCSADASPSGLRKVEPSWVLRTVRKGGSVAWIPLHPAAVYRLTEYLQGRLSGPLLMTASGKPWDRRAIHRTLSAMGRSLGFQLPLGPHTLRHTFVTLARQAGCPLEDVQDAVGHANPATTRRYDQTRPQHANHPGARILTALSA